MQLLLFLPQELEDMFMRWGDLVHHGPVILAWAAVRFIVMEGDVDTPQVRYCLLYQL